MSKKDRLGEDSLCKLPDNQKIVQSRVFIVGCPRSGTTLLQSLLGANSHIATFPESHFFLRLVSGRRLLVALGIASRHARPRLEAFFEEIGYTEKGCRALGLAISVRRLSRIFVQALDALTLERGKTMWVEKTPEHVHCVDQIAELVPKAKFVHILRRGEDVVASLYEIGIRYPELWGGYTQSIDLAIQRWNEDVQLSMKCVSRENHFLLRYEKLVADPRPLLVEICKFIGVPFEEHMLTDYAAVASQVVLEEEPWKAKVGQPIRVPSSKFHTLFNEEQRQYIRECLWKDLPGSELQEMSRNIHGLQATNGHREIISQ